MDAFASTRLMIVAPNVTFVRLFLAEQIELLAAENFEIQLVCAPDQTSTDRLAGLPCTVSFLAMARQISLGKDCAALIQLLSLIYRSKPAIVHMHGPKPSLLAAIAAWLGGVPIRLHTLHGLRSDGLRGKRRAIVRAMERITFVCSTRCFAVSHSLAEHVIEAGFITPQKMTVLRYGSWAGVALDRFSPQQNQATAKAFRRNHGIEANALVVTYLGRLARDKGLHTLAEAWNMLSHCHPQARLLVAGPLDRTDPPLPENLRSLCADPKVTLLEHFVEDVPTLLAASDIFVQPSLREGLGVAALEAAAMELPVIAARVTGLVDTVEHNISGLLFAPENAAALAQSLDLLLTQPETRQTFGKNGRVLVQEKFSRPDVLNATLAMYRECAKKDSQPSAWSRIGKRTFDLATALFLLILVSPLMLVIAVAIGCFLSRSVLFTQQRAGFHGKPIRIYKFRTMKSLAPGQPMIGTEELRSHWLGNLLRKFSLDELPQIFNVVRGEMSLVGPRPLLLDYLPRYTKQQRHRHDALPGITGWAQVNGRNAISWEQRFQLDLWYIEHRSARLDLFILLLTACRVAWPQGVTPQGHTSMAEFLGASNHVQS